MRTTRNTHYIQDSATGEEAAVEYETSGGFARQTLYSPAEVPEVDILSDLPEWADEDRVREEIIDELRDYRYGSDPDAERDAWLEDHY